MKTTTPTWEQRVRDLQGVGLTLAEIGEQIGLTTSAVGDIATGRSAAPRGEAAVKLHMLHQLRCTGSQAAPTGHAA